MLTFGQLKASEVPATVGVCPDSDVFKDYTNKATRMLMNRGSFYGTVQRLKICVYNNCLVWPRTVSVPLAINTGGGFNEVWNHWYEFMPLGHCDFGYGRFSWNGALGQFCGNLRTINDGVSPVFNNIPCGRTHYIRAYPSTQEDIGKKTRIFGIDENGQVIRTQNADNTWSEGVELTLALPFVSTSFKLREVTRIIKDETEGVLRYYQYDDENAVLLDLVVLDPSETNPMYRRSRLPSTCRSRSCTTPRSIEALVKLEFIPVKHDTDLVLISNQDALSDMMLSVKYSNGGDALMAKDFEAKALRELNLELNSRIPIEQTPVQINPFGSALPARASVGRII